MLSPLWTLYVPLGAMLAFYIALFVFRKSLARYLFTYRYRVLVPLAAMTLGGWRGLLVVLPLYSIYFFFREYRSAQAVADIATSRIGSAAQGYCEIIGRGVHTQAVVSPVSGKLCLWYHYQHYRTRGWLSRWLFDRSKWELVDSGCHDGEFSLHDGTDVCYVNPKGAQVSELEFEEWHIGNECFREVRLSPDRDLYVLGHFATETESQRRSQLRLRTGTLIGEWKANLQTYLRRFDVDGDGEVGEQDFVLVRAAAQRQAHKELGGAPFKNTVAKPEDGRPFIISHHAHHKLIRRHKLHSYFYVFLFVVSSMALAKQLMGKPPRGYWEGMESYPSGWPAIVVNPGVYCSDITGSYAVISSAGKIGLAETFIGLQVKDNLANKPPRQYYRPWEVLTYRIHSDTSGSKYYRPSTHEFILERSQASIRAFENDLQMASQEEYAIYMEMRDPEARRFKRLYMNAEKSQFIQPASMSDDEFDNQLDRRFLGARYSLKTKSDSLSSHCSRGWVTITSGTAERPIDVALHKDVAGNLVARKGYWEVVELAGFKFQMKYVVLDWARWPVVQPGR